MIYVSARWADEAQTMVIGTDADGRIEVVPADHVVFRQPEHGPIGFVANGGVIAEYEPPPSHDSTLTKRQICAALIIGGVTSDPDGWMTSILENITDPVARALALNDWRNAPYYERTHVLFNDINLLQNANLNKTDIDNLWNIAINLPA